MIACYTYKKKVRSKTAALRASLANMVAAWVDSRTVASPL
jgi:hypothetical protein